MMSTSFSNISTAEYLHSDWLLSNSGLSPTTLRTYMECPRKSYLQRFNVGRFPDNIHFAFGNAFGHAAAYIVEHYRPFCNKNALAGAAMMQTLRFISEATNFKGKTFYNMAVIVSALVESWGNWYASGYRFHSAETKFKVQAGGFAFNGMQDVLLYNELTKSYCIVDFKAIGNGYYYNWALDPQIMLYSFMSWLHTGGEYEEGHYMVAEFQPDNLSLSRHSVKAGAYKMIPALIETALQAKVVHETPPSQLSCIPISTPTCKKGTWYCDFVDICSGEARAFAQSQTDDRVVNAVAVIKLNSIDELRLRAAEFAERMSVSEPESSQPQWDVLDMEL